VCLLAFSVCDAFAQQSRAVALRGQVLDAFGAAIVGATVTLSGAADFERATVTNGEGVYVFNGLPAGRYIVRATAQGFAPFENGAVDLAAGQTKVLDIKLEVTLEAQDVTVDSEPPVSTDSENNADAIRLRGRDLDILPDNPDELAAVLQVMAGASGGPNGGQIYIDGFTGGRLPPKESIREIRVTQNVFNAEYDRFGAGRVDILTRPGTGQVHGSIAFNFNNESLNSRNPFAPSRTPFQSRLLGGSISGPLVAKKSSYFLDFQWRDTDANSIINAIVLDPGLNITRLSQTVLLPQRFITISPRFDYQLNKDNTLIARYSFTRSTFQNEGVGVFSLPEQGFNRSNTEQTVQLTETAVLSTRLINETRFQYIRTRAEQTSDNSRPAINVLEAFTSGPSQVGLAFNRADRWELQNYSTLIKGRQILRFGARLRGTHISDISPQNFGGTFIFAGGLAPRLDSGDRPVLDPATGNPFIEPITSIERYRRTLLFQNLPAAQRVALGAVPTQFTISSGQPEASVRRLDVGFFLQDEWRPNPQFTLTLGMRYEAQTNISSPLNFGPRIFFAWAPGKAKGGAGAGPPKTVIRGGMGVFYDRFSEVATLQANRFNGINQQRFILTDPAVLGQVVFSPDGSVTNVPSISSAGFTQRQVSTRVADDFQAPYNLLASLNFERQLPHKFTLFGVVLSTTSRHAIRLRNVNAPLPGTFNPADPTTGARPFGNIGDIYQYESSGNVKIQQMIVGFRNQLSRSFSAFGNYVFTRARGDTDCIFGALGDCFPANSYDLSSENGRSGLYSRHTFFMSGTYNVPRLKLAFSPFIVGTTGRPFNIITGRDTNGDGLYTERPAFANADTRPEDLRRTPFGDFDINPAPGQPLIPRNLGEGPSIFAVNLNVSRTFDFGRRPAPPPAAAAGQQRAGGAAGGASGERPYHLTLSVQVQNLFNRANLAPAVGNLSSPFFGQSIGTTYVFGLGSPAAANRRVELQMRFNF
jgi:hypothetical protein